VILFFFLVVLRCRSWGGGGVVVGFGEKELFLLGNQEGRTDEKTALLRFALLREQKKRRALFPPSPSISQFLPPDDFSPPSSAGRRSLRRRQSPSLVILLPRIIPVPSLPLPLPIMLHWRRGVRDSSPLASFLLYPLRPSLRATAFGYLRIILFFFFGGCGNPWCQ
jgi:hypothetical protein